MQEKKEGEEISSEYSSNMRTVGFMSTDGAVPPAKPEPSPVFESNN